MVLASTSKKFLKNKFALDKQTSFMENTFKHVTRNLLKIRRSTLKNICKDFGINILFRFKKLDVEHIEYITDDDVLEENFVYFLMENKTFIEFYESDYYSDKTIEIIANKIQKNPKTVEDYLLKIKYKFKSKTPYRYVSSYAIDFKLGGNYNFFNYKKDHNYQGNYEFRRK